MRRLNKQPPNACKSLSGLNLPAAQAVEDQEDRAFSVSKTGYSLSGRMEANTVFYLLQQHVPKVA